MQKSVGVSPIRSTLCPNGDILKPNNACLHEDMRDGALMPNMIGNVHLLLEISRAIKFELGFFNSTEHLSKCNKEIVEILFRKIS